MIASQHLYVAPGSAHRYNNGSYVLLSVIVECAAGMDLADFVKKRIFDPLGMRR